MTFEWDMAKNRLNKVKHGIDFATAALVFGDDERLEFYDETHSEDEERYITIGAINGIVTVLFVVYTERSDSIRIVSARKANEAERRPAMNSQEKV